MGGLAGPHELEGQGRLRPPESRPVPDMAPCRREHLDHLGVGTLEHVGQVANHPTRSVGQSQLDRPVQILNHITEPAADINDHHLTDGPCPGANLPAGGLIVSWLRLRVSGQGIGQPKERGTQVARCTLLGGWTKANLFRWSGMEDTATEVREQREHKSQHQSAG